MWIARFHFTQGFLTGSKQNYARKYKIAIDLLDYDYEVVRDQEHAMTNPPDDGVHILGPFIEGCRWNFDTQLLDESEAKVLHTPMPMVWIRPAKLEDFIQSKTYACPMYKTSIRKGVLMTTGHSTNFVLKVRLPTRADESHWILRGVAIILGLDE